MIQTQLRDFVQRYFTALNCHILEAGPQHLKVKLSIEADKDLTNRPLYWAFAERLGETPNTLVLHLCFSREASGEGEFVTWGTPRMDKILDSIRSRGRFVHLYQEGALAPFAPATPSQPLLPWLGAYYKAQLICDQKMDCLYSIGVSLLTGEVRTGFDAELKRLHFSAHLPPRSHPVAPLLSIRESVRLAEQKVKEELANLDNRWAQEAEQRYQIELAQLSDYYSLNATGAAEESVKADFIQRAKELEWQYKPRVEVECIQSGIYYLTHAFRKEAIRLTPSPSTAAH